MSITSTSGAQAQANVSRVHGRGKHTHTQILCLTEIKSRATRNVTAGASSTVTKVWADYQLDFRSCGGGLKICDA